MFVGTLLDGCVLQQEGQRALAGGNRMAVGKEQRAQVAVVNGRQPLRVQSFRISTTASNARPRMELATPPDPGLP
ncbi:hypothetical protein [Streptomyces sp. NPDC127033]|uniref:hypothetical protein n=1 Tax=Streptomyces sp. NPDC127033 TaxID=3347110 RepID=UPI00364B03B1